MLSLTPEHWREKARNNIMCATDLADAFGGDKKTYLRKLNLTLRKRIKENENLTATLISSKDIEFKEVPHGVSKGLENLVNVFDRLLDHRVSDNLMGTTDPWTPEPATVG